MLSFFDYERGFPAPDAASHLDLAPQIEKEQLTPPPRLHHEIDKEYISALGRSLAALSEKVGRLEKSGNQVANDVTVGGPCLAAPEAAAEADGDDQRCIPSLHQYVRESRRCINQLDYPAAQDGTRALLCLMQYSRQHCKPLNQQYSLDKFRALIDSRLLFQSIGLSKEEALAMRMAELEGRVRELEKQADKPLPPPSCPKVLRLERALDKVRDKRIWLQDIGSSHKRLIKNTKQVTREHQAMRAAVASMSYLIEALSASVVVEDKQDVKETTSPPKA
jgi:hypothetical protein